MQENMAPETQIKTVKKGSWIIRIISLIIFSLLLILSFNQNRFISLLERFRDIPNLLFLQTFFSIYVIENNDILSRILADLNTLRTSTMNNWWPILQSFGLRLGSFILNYGVMTLLWLINVYILFSVLKANAEKKRVSIVQKTKGAELLEMFVQRLKLFCSYIKIKVKMLIGFLKKKKTRIKLIIFALTYLFIAKILLEIIIFLIVYFISILLGTTHFLLLDIIAWAAIVLYNFISYTGVAAFILILITLKIVRYMRGLDKKLLKNHRRVINFIRSLNQLKIINGVPGSGKTLLNSYMSSGQEEIFIMDIEKKMRDIVRKHPAQNFQEVLRFPESFIDNPKLYEYFEYYDILKNRGSYIISNYPIRSFIFERNSKILDLDYLRPIGKYNNHKPLEPYISISWSEVEKDINSHASRSSHIDEGWNITFGVISQYLERKVSIILDYQIASQFPLMLRDTSENFIQLEGKAKLKAFKFLRLIELLFMLYDRMIEKLVDGFSHEKDFVKDQSRKKPIETKRKDYTLLYGIFRYLYFINGFFISWLYSKKFIKLEIYLYPSSEQVKAERKSITVKLNIRDLDKDELSLYNSTFLRDAYLAKYLKSELKFRDIPEWSSISPTSDDLAKVHSDFYDDAFGLNDEIVPGEAALEEGMVANSIDSYPVDF
ncbi:MAG: hypothetical protein FWE36_05155 [Erysipelotrichales bacterium]|nr:hypothetical protein [Erysipelotrichales bacterium]